MAHQGESGGSMWRPSNPSGHFTPSSPTPATIGAQASQAHFQENQHDASIGARAPQLGHPIAADTQVPPAVAPPQSFHFQPESQPHWTMPQAGVQNAMPPLQHFIGTAAVQPPLHGDELAARAAAINTSPYQPFQPNNYAHGWPQGPPLPPPPPPQAPPAPRYADGYGYGAASWARPMLPPSDWRGSWAPPPAQQPSAGGQTSWAPPVQQQPGGQASWAWAPPPPAQLQQRPGMPAPASPASGSAQAQPPRVTGGKVTFEEFLLEAGVLDQPTVDKIFLDDLAEEMLGDGHDDHLVSLEDVLLSLGAVSSSRAGPSKHQVRMPAQEELASGAGPSTRQVRRLPLPAQEELASGAGPSTRQVCHLPLPAQEELGAGAGATGGCGPEQAAAAEARERRSRRMAKRKEVANRHHHHPEKHAAGPRRSQNGPGAI